MDESNSSTTSAAMAEIHLDFHSEFKYLRSRTDYEQHQRARSGLTTGFDFEVTVAEKTAHEETRSCNNMCSANCEYGHPDLAQTEKEVRNTVETHFRLDPADLFINLPDDLIREVLRWVNPRDILRLRRLNKSWNSEMNRLTADEWGGCCRQCI